jgi:thiamine biosynthesis protein ThiI
MDDVTRVIATTGEISLKGENRRWFEKALTTNVAKALADLPVAAVKRPSWRVLVEFSEPVPFREVARRLSTVFGLGAIMAAEHAGRDLEAARAAIGRRLAGLAPASFAVRCTRSDKRFPMTSPDIEAELGTFVGERTGWPVDLGSPDLTVNLLVDENGFWLWLDKVPGPGGLPVGVGGRATCLLSGGIDSPVAAYLMMKRGMRLDFVHFHSVPQTDPASIEKAEDLVRVLGRYQGVARLAIVPLLPIQDAVIAHCDPELRVLLYRRFMLRLAARMAHRFRASALVTGESLGQVASQTVENLAAVEAVTTMTVLRPLISLDKQEIVAIARRAGTYDISTRAHGDCCSYHVPQHPATRSTPGELAAEEDDLDVERLFRQALAGAEVRRISEAAAWTAIPVPGEQGNGAGHR